VFWGKNFDAYFPSHVQIYIQARPTINNSITKFRAQFPFVQMLLSTWEMQL